MTVYTKVLTPPGRPLRKLQDYRPKTILLQNLYDPRPFHSKEFHEEQNRKSSEFLHAVFGLKSNGMHSGFPESIIPTIKFDFHGVPMLMGLRCNDGERAPYPHILISPMDRTSTWDATKSTIEKKIEDYLDDRRMSVLETTTRLRAAQKNGTVASNNLDAYPPNLESRKRP